MIMDVVNVMELKISWHQFDKLFFNKRNGSMVGSREHRFISVYTVVFELTAVLVYNEESMKGSYFICIYGHIHT